MSRRRSRPDEYGISARSLARIIDALLSHDEVVRCKEATKLASAMHPKHRPDLRPTVEFREMDDDEWTRCIRRMCKRGPTDGRVLRRGRTKRRRDSTNQEGDEEE